MATSHSAPAFAGVFAPGSEDYVWPHPNGPLGGAGVMPLHPNVPYAAMQDSKPYEMLALFDALGVKVNVVFFERKPASETPWTRKLWIYDLRTNQHFTLKTNPLRREHLEEFVKLYHPANRHERKATWSAEANAAAGTGPDGRWRVYDYAELIARDKASLDIFWLKDDSLADSDNLPPPDVIAQEIVDDLEAALEQFRLIAGDLQSSELSV